MRPIRTLCTLTVLFLLSATGSAPVHAQSTGAVQGRVTNAETGRPLPSVNVLVEGTDDGPQRGTSTGPQGQFAVDGLEPRS